MPVRLPILSILLSLISACTLLPEPKNQPVGYYRLELPEAALPKVNGRGRVVELAAVHVFPAYDSARIAYRKEGEVLGYHARYRWVDTPARQLAPLLADALGASGCCAAVVLPGSGVLPDERLEIDLMRFEIDYRSTPARFRLVARLRDVEVAQQRMRASRRVVIEEPLARVGPEAGVAAANRCIARLAAAAARLLGADRP